MISKHIYSNDEYQAFIKEEYSFLLSRKDDSVAFCKKASSLTVGFTYQEEVSALLYKKLRDDYSLRVFSKAVLQMDIDEEYSFELILFDNLVVNVKAKMLGWKEHFLGLPFIICEIGLSEDVFPSVMEGLSILRITKFFKYLHHLLVFIYYFLIFIY